MVKAILDDILVSLDADFARLYDGTLLPSIAPERLLRASLLRAFYSVRSERQLMEQIDYNLLLRWFVGLGIDDPVWDHSTFPEVRPVHTGPSRRMATSSQTTHRHRE